jgi:uncharacterized protein YecA (UPF0149 family)
MQETTYRDRNSGEIKKLTEMFHVPADEGGRESVLRKRYDEAMRQVFANGHDLVSIRQGKIGRNDPCPCGSSRKFKRCCEAKMNTAIATGSA